MAGWVSSGGREGEGGAGGGGVVNVRARITMFVKEIPFGEEVGEVES